MVNVKIYGAGSIGNHLAYACRRKGWHVTICDLDKRALERTKKSIYPSRYGKWDNSIELMHSIETDNNKYDIIIIGTPPDKHLELGIKILKSKTPKVMAIEKPLSTPSLDGVSKLYNMAKDKNVRVLVNYNHTLTKNTKIMEELLAKGVIGTPLTMTALTREYWGGIFNAHPWLNGPEDSYLGYYIRGGGACGEHSHALNIFQHFLRVLKLGRIKEVQAKMDIVQNGNAKYDRLALINISTETGFVGNIIQDVITFPAQKQLRIQGTKGYVDWYVNYDSKYDAVIYGNEAKIIKKYQIEKIRPDDFQPEINHMEQLLEDPNIYSPISLENGIETMMVIASSYLSNQQMRTMTIDYSNGYNLASIK